MPGESKRRREYSEGDKGQSKRQRTEQNTMERVNNPSMKNISTAAATDPVEFQRVY